MIFTFTKTCPLFNSKMMNRPYTLFAIAVMTTVLLILTNHYLDDQVFQRVPTSLITGAVAYRVELNENDPFIRNGQLPQGIIDSVMLDKEKIDQISHLANSPLSDALSFPGCFYPDFIIKFTGGYFKDYVGHVTVSIDCEQIKFTDNSGIHVLTTAQIEDMKKLYEGLFKESYSPPIY